MVLLPVYMALLLAGVESRESIRFLHAAEQSDPLGCGKAVLKSVLEKWTTPPSLPFAGESGAEAELSPGTATEKGLVPLPKKETITLENKEFRTGKNAETLVPDPVASLLNEIPENSELSAFAIQQILSRAGMKAVVLKLTKTELEEAVRQFTSIILHFNRPSGHYVQLRTAGGWGAIISDPAEGTVWISSRQLEQRWSGVAICADLRDTGGLSSFSAEISGSSLRAGQKTAGSEAEGRMTLIHRLLRPGLKGSVP